jgi:hypothetical protein
VTSLAVRLRRKLATLRDRRAPRLSVVREATEGRPPIFIIGCQRSGTSLLRRIVDAHPAIACPPESKFLMPLTDVLRDEQSLRGLDSMGFDRVEVVAALREMASAFFAGYARARGKPRWADKTPNYVDCLSELAELFGDARFLLIVRDGLDVAFSLSEGRYRFPALERHIAEAGGDAPVAAGRFWAEQNDKIERFRAANPASCLRVRYEELTSEPEVTLRQVFEFVGEDWSPSVLAFNESPHDAGLEDPTVRWRDAIEPNSGRWRAWPGDVAARVVDACGPMLATLGYPRPTLDGRGEP